MAEFECWADELIAQLETRGFSTVVLTDEAARSWRSVYEVAPAYFNQSDEDKARDEMAGGYGYRKLGAEYSQSPHRPDPFESFTAAEQTRTVRFGSDVACSLNEAMLKVVDAANRTVEAILRQLGARFDVPNGAVGAFIRQAREWSCLQLNYSRPAFVTPEYIHEAHEDGHLVTLASAMAEGLEIESPPGEFTAVTPRPPDVLIMPGNIMTLLTGGIIRPLYHRVRALKSVPDRFALVYFVDPDPRTCGPWVTNEINHGVDIGSLILANPARFGLDPLPAPETDSFSAE